MKPIDFIAGKTLKKPFRYHSASAPQPLFRWLKNQHDGASEVASFGKIAGGAQ